MSESLHYRQRLRPSPHSDTVKSPSPGTSRRSADGGDSTSRLAARRRLKSYYKLASETQQQQPSSSESLESQRQVATGASSPSVSTTVAANSVKPLSVLSPLSTTFYSIFGATKGYTGQSVAATGIGADKGHKAGPAQQGVIAHATQRSGGSTSRGEQPACTTEMDSPQFNSKVYLRRMLRECGASDLLSLDNQLVSEIRHLDGEMRNMIYQNYSQFISATDAIERLNHQLAVMDEEMDALTKKVDGMVTRATAIAAPLAQRSQRIYQLSATHKLLLKLQFLYDVPSQLNAYISRGELALAARVWAKTRPLFDRYRQLGVFAGLERDGKAIVSGVEATVWSRWRDPATTAVEGNEYSALLAMLSPERAKELWKSYLEIQTEKLRALCDQLVTSVASQGRPQHASRRQFARSTDDLDIDGDGSHQLRTSTLAAQKPPTSRPASLVESFDIYTTARRNSLATNSLTTLSPATDDLRTFNNAFLPVWNSVLIGFVIQFLPHGDSRSSLVAGGTHDLARATETLGIEDFSTDMLIELLSPTTPGCDHFLASRSFVPAWRMVGEQDWELACSALDKAIGDWQQLYVQAVSSIILSSGHYTSQTSSFSTDTLDQLIDDAERFPLLVRAGRLGYAVTSISRNWQAFVVDTALDHLLLALSDQVVDYLKQPFVPPNIPRLPPPGPMLPSGGDSGKASEVQRQHTKRPHSISTANLHWSIRAATTTATATPGSNDSTSRQYWASSPRLQFPAVTAVSPRGHRRAASSVSSPTFEISTRPQRSRSFKFPSNAESPSNPGPPGGIPHNRRSSRPELFALPRAASPLSATHSSHLQSSSGVASAAKAAPPVQGLTFNQSPRHHHRYNHQYLYHHQYQPHNYPHYYRHKPPRAFVTDLEAWFIEQVLSKFSLILETIAQHYSDNESSDLIQGSSPSQASTRHTLRLLAPRSTVFSRLLNMFVRITSTSLQQWISKIIPEAFASIAGLDDATDDHPDAPSPAPDAEYSCKTPPSPSIDTPDQAGLEWTPLANLLMARLCLDFEQSLTRNIYQFCEQALAVAKDRGSNPDAEYQCSRSNSLVGSNTAVHSPTYPTLAHSQPASKEHVEIEPGAPGSVPAAGAEQFDILSCSTHGDYDNHARFVYDIKEYSASWNSTAQRLVWMLIRRVGLRLVDTYLKGTPEGHNLTKTDRGCIAGVSAHWIDICRQLRQLETDVNDIFYDPAFGSAKDAPLVRAHHAEEGQGGAGSEPAVSPRPFLAEDVGRKGAVVDTRAMEASISGGSGTFHGEFFSTIDELFGEHLDDHSLKASEISSGNIMTHISLLVLKAEIGRVSPVSETHRCSTGPRAGRAWLNQVLVDTAFVRLWVARYAGVLPILDAENHPAGSVYSKKQVPSGRADGGAPAAPRGQPHPQPPHTHLRSDVHVSGKGRQINEPALRSIQRLIAEWIQATRKSVSLIDEEGNNDDIDGGPLSIGTINDMVEIAWSRVLSLDSHDI